jgi:hypothetical protein
MVAQILLSIFLSYVLADTNIYGDNWAYFCVGNCNQDVETPTVGGTINMVIYDAFSCSNNFREEVVM